MRRFLVKFANLFRGRSAERELDREVASHLGMLQEAFELRGFVFGRGKRVASRAYGGVEQAKELHREARSFIWIEHLVKDAERGNQGQKPAGEY